MRVRRRLRRVPLACLLALSVLCAIVVILVVFPRTDRPRPVDAVIVLGPPTTGSRLQTGLNLVRSGFAPTLVVSVPAELQRQLAGTCAETLASAQLICFQPQSNSTRGEARSIAELARQHNWRSVLVVSSRYHLSRARMLLSRCYDGTIRMVDAPQKLTFGDWLHHLAYEAGAYAKSLLSWGC